uniref:Uncharacterized protein n=1 Tax=Parascaris equorum TaxID=6256 RepID=A0A914RD46_PAREQ
MSLPRMCALPSSSDVEKEKQRLTAAAMFPGLQFMGFPTVTTAGSSQYYANFIHQQQMLQNLHSHSPQSRIGSTFHFAV